MLVSEQGMARSGIGAGETAQLNAPAMASDVKSKLPTPSTATTPLVMAAAATAAAAMGPPPSGCTTSKSTTTTMLSPSTAAVVVKQHRKSSSSQEEGFVEGDIDEEEEDEEVERSGDGSSLGEEESSSDDQSYHTATKIALPQQPITAIKIPPPTPLQASLPSSPPPLSGAPTTSEYPQMELADLKVVTTLGVGGFGRVDLVRCCGSSGKGGGAAERVFALKVMNKRHVREMHQQEHVLNERHILHACRHCPFVVHLHRTFRDSQRLYLLMEYCPGGEVWTQLRNWGRFDESTARFYCAAAVEAFDFLHRRLILYRDLKPENMLLDADGWPKLVDFGFAKRLRSESARTWTFCGTAEYVAPEIILNKGQDTAVDIWALGIFIYELISGSPPFASTDPMHTYNSILRGVQCLAYPRHMSDSAKQLICRLCRREPAQRLGSYNRLDELRRDSWFAGGGGGNSGGVLGSVCGGGKSASGRAPFDFEAFRARTLKPPIQPRVRSATDTQNFDRYPVDKDTFASGVDESGWDEEF